jgi:ubiquinone biosynthesis protein
MAARHEREREIVSVLARHGMTGLVGAMDAPPRELRVALEELGPTFVKLGQLASTRADLLAPAFRTELARLQDGAAPPPRSAVAQTLDRELGARARTAFASIELEPIATGSIGTAHAAVLRDGTPVIVKVRRPGAAELVERDLEILVRSAETLSRHWEPAAGVDLVGLADEFARGLRAELDYELEAANAERFARNFAQDPKVRIPRVFRETTTSQVITLERVSGMNVTDTAALDAAGVDRRELAREATRMMATMVFEHGFFHGDPHPGNFFVQSEGRIAMIDFGLVGELDDRLRDGLAALLTAAVRDSPSGLAGALIDLGASSDHIDRAQLENELQDVLGRYRGVTVGELKLSDVFADLLELARRHRLRLPRDLALLAKVVAVEEGMAAELDPDFSIGETLAPYAQRQLLAELSVDAIGQRLGSLIVDIRRALAVVGDGGLELRPRTDELEALVGRTERLGNRIAASILLAAMINAAVELTVADRIRPRDWRPARLAALGALSGYVAWSRGPGRSS